MNDGVRSFCWWQFWWHIIKEKHLMMRLSNLEALFHSSSHTCSDKTEIGNKRNGRSDSLGSPSSWKSFPTSCSNSVPTLPRVVPAATDKWYSHESFITTHKKNIMPSHTTLLAAGEHDAIPRFQGLDLANERILFLLWIMLWWFFGGEALKLLLCTDKLYLTSTGISFPSRVWLVQKEEVA